MGFEKKSRPACRAYLANNQSIPNATWTDIVFDAEEYDTDAMFAPPDHIIYAKRLAGYYLLVGQVTFAGGTTGFRVANINGAFNLKDTVASDWYTSVQVTSLRRLAVNDPVTLGVYQNSGAALNAQGDANLTWLSVTHLSGR